MFLYPLFGVAASAFLVSLGLKFDLSKSDWASWVQALGSVAALAVAMFVMWWQTRLAGKAAKAKELERQRNLVVAAHHCAIRLKSALDGLELTATLNNRDQNNLQYFSASLASTLGAMDRIPMWEISSTAALDLGAITVVCNTAIVVVDRARATTNEQDWGFFCVQILAMQEMLKKKEDALLAVFREIELELKNNN